ncbi:MAG TPA: peroxiredoxin [Candidatus Tripitaka californicus]|uniref:peroxiredoxin n=1 Tax=Candidatus Tripitaka californicus TaxID=3367616 RepID=UPI004027A042|nr:peroxiredoxin [Planctomycetota bacterium]
MVKIGDKAPQFEEMAYVKGAMKKVKLADYNGKWVVLFFYPLDFTFICPTEIEGFAKFSKEFGKLGAVVVGASTDSEYSHKAWFEGDSRLKEVAYPVLADTAHRVSRAYGVLKEDKGIAYRGTFIIDPEGVIRYTLISDLSAGRSVKETLRVLQALQSGELCPVEWTPGQKTLGKA